MPRNGEQGIWMDMDAAYHVTDSLLTLIELRFYSDSLLFRNDSLEKKQQACAELSSSLIDKTSEQQSALELAGSTIDLGLAKFNDCESDKSKLKSQIVLLKLQALGFKITTGVAVAVIVYQALSK